MTPTSKSELPAELLNTITKLSSCIDGDIDLTCNELVNIIHAAPARRLDDGKEKGKSFLYSQDDLDETYSLAWTYTVKRLLRGLASTSELVRINFATALYAVLRLYNPIPLNMIFEWIQHLLCKHLDTNLKRSEEAALLRGRLIAYNILISCCDLGEFNYKLIAQNVVPLLSNNQQIERMAYDLLIKLKSRCQVHDLEEIYGRCQKENDGRSRVLLMCISNQDSSQVKKDKLVEHDVEHLREVLGSGENLQLVYTYAHCLLYNLVKASDINGFTRCWKEICAKINENGKIWGPFVRGLLIDLFCLKPADEFIIKMLCTDSLVSYIGKCSAEFAFISRNILDAQAVLWTVLKKLIEHKNIELASAILTVVPADDLMAILTNVFSLPDEIMLFPAHYFDLSLLLIRNMPKEADKMKIIIRCLLNFCIVFGRHDNKVQERMQGIFLHTIQSNSEIETKERIGYWIDFVLDNILNCHYTKKTSQGKQNIESLDLPIQNALNLGRKLLLKLGPSCDDAVVQALNKMVRVSLLLLTVFDPLAAVSIFEDLKGCLKSLKRQSTARPDEVNPVEVMIDILLSWLSRPSYLLRLFSDYIFATLVPYLTSNALDSIAHVITSDPRQYEGDLIESEDDIENGSKVEWNDVNPNNFNCLDNSVEEKDSRWLQERDPKRVKRGNDQPNSTDESEMINLDDANEEELEALDHQLGSIMAARGKSRSFDTTRDFVHFKQRVCDWIEMVNRNTGKSQTFPTSCKLLFMVMKAIIVHPVPKDHAKGSKFALDSELLAKLSNLLKLICKSAQTQTVTLDQFEQQKALDAASSLLSSLSDRKAKANEIARIFPGIWFILGICDQQMQVVALQPLWEKLITELDKKHSSSLLPFFRDLSAQKGSNLILLLTIHESSLEKLGECRFNTLALVLKMSKLSLKLADTNIAKQFYSIMQNLFNDSRFRISPHSKSPAFSHVRNELSLFYDIVIRSKTTLGQQTCEFWYDTLSQAERYIIHLSTAGQFQTNQTSSLIGRLKSTLSLLKTESK